MKKNYLSVNNNNRSNKGGFLPCSTLFRIAKTGLSEVPLSLHSSVPSERYALLLSRAAHLQTKIMGTFKNCNL